jgi:signal transduction histidine kinase/ActR/RegA family two-component response regulator
MVKKKDTVLYVDDELFNLELFKETFEGQFNVLTDYSTKTAFKLLEKNSVKVIISDQRMPEETGLSFLERVHKTYPDIIKIIFTAYLDHDAALHAINQGGIFRYLLKPWNITEIRSTLSSAIREYNLKEENVKLVNELQLSKKDLEKALNKAKENEQKFHDIFLNSNDAIIILKGTKLLEANPAFYQLMNINTNGTITEIQKFIETRNSQLLNALNDDVVTEAIKEIEIKSANLEKKSIELNSRTVEYHGEKAIQSIVRDITERKQLENKILDAIIRTQEEDRVRYAQELHDGLGPILSTLKMYIEWLFNEKNTVNKDEIAGKTIVSINEAITRLKEIANNLSPHVLQRFGLINAIQNYIDQIRSTKDIEILLTSNLKSRLPVNIETILYRVVLECLNNSMKHSQAKKIFIKFRLEDSYLTINYSDNGIGFNVEEVTKEGKGMGLFNIQNRIKLLNGKFKINSIKNIGTDIEIKIEI